MTLKDFRIISGIKAKKIAEILGISRAQLNNLEKGIYRLSKLKIEKLCEVYSVKEEDILQAWEESKDEQLRKRIK
ncbi:XRE family transcriptional regulator [Clostridium tetani]|uniref:helix-turn-helix domain-containing protein n=1 Tax=Clostridium phage phiCT19406C TaxID=1567011 RepID=UPI0005139C3C|nr:helix-turn-helix transcriptional regulator [Clostridium tetani]YP_009218032.1 helix-turn-helix domain-containing protein [Clostridium phage phiCT19406C]AJA42826.1 XRE transcriptional regulator [Clostridium phage phiCT19406C]KGI44966.1 hypothetical protein KY54_06615 [Clostridium tetani]KHO32404.1 hypothetical protein OR63_06570 [Clostridium tetani]RXI59877.1 XRE family transcriptional regulator [Clostridium tetani]RXI62309.1 XRE family transcriptional regulator [Clostridium tetani]